jgi:ELWxxDGT repeat protein
MHIFAAAFLLFFSFFISACGLMDGEVSPYKIPPPPSHPKEFTYQTKTFDIKLNTPITTQLPQIAENGINQPAGTTYSVTPAFPEGITLNENTGQISGSPTESLTSTEFIITASNSLGSTQTEIDLEVDFYAPAGALLADVAKGIDHSIGRPLYYRGELNGQFIFEYTSGSKFFFKTDGTQAGSEFFELAGEDPAFVGELTTLGDLFFYIAKDQNGYYQPFVSNGTTQGSRLLKTINTTADSVNASAEFMRFGDLVLFAANDGSTGYELWRTDGTESGTQRIKDVYPGSTGQLPLMINDAIPLGDKVFISLNSANGYEPWITDGTEAGTIELKDIDASGDGMEPTYYCLTGSYVVFVGDDGTGERLWRSDGSPSGTEVVKPSMGTGTISRLECMGSGQAAAFQWANSPTSSVYLTDGTDAGTVELSSGHGSGMLEVHSSCLNRSILRMDSDLWVTDGSLVGTEVWPYGVSNPIEFSGKCFFNDANKAYSTNMTVAGTSVFLNDSAAGFSGSTDRFLFFSKNSEDNNTLYAWEGIGAEFQTIDHELLLGSGSLVAETSSKILFLADVTTDKKIFTIDKNTLSAELLGPLTNDIATSKPGDYFVFGDMLLFSASLPGMGRELYMTDLTTWGTKLIKDINPGNDSSNPTDFVNMGEYVLFVAETRNEGIDLWRTDGTTNGTYLVKDTCPGVCGSGGANIREQRRIGDLLYFATNGEPWISDGTALGTRMLKDINTSGSSNPRQFQELGPWIYFIARPSDGGTGNEELWRTDGSETNTQRAYDFNSGGNDGVTHFVVVGSDIYLSGCSGTENNDGLLKFDGSSYTFIVDPLYDVPIPGCFSGLGVEIVRDMHTVNGNIVFVRYDLNFISGVELVVHDTGAGTTHLTDFYPGTFPGVEDYSLHSYNGKVYFIGKDASHDYIRTTDGTLAGTYNLTQSSGFSWASKFIEYDGQLHYAGVIGSQYCLARTNGEELNWTEITCPADDYEMTIYKDTLIYQKCTDEHGCELWGKTLE